MKVCNWGCNDSQYPVRVDGKDIPAYRAWSSMLHRCYDPKLHARSPTYIGCSVDPVWQGFSAFQSWHTEHYRKGFQLDKDILIQGNKIYSPETCVYVPSHINSLLLANEASRGDWPVGVYWHKTKQKFRAHLKVKMKMKHLGYFNDPMEAHEAYKVAKKAYIKQVAIEAFFNNEIKSDVYLALIRREF